MSSLGGEPLDGGERACLTRSYIAADRVMLWLVMACYGLTLALAPWYATWQSALLLGTPTLLGCWFWAQMLPGSLLTRMAMSAGLMTFAALQIHQSRGMIEFHFSIFCLIGCLVYYRDWRPIVFAAVFVAVHHVVVSFLQATQWPVYAFPPGRFTLDLVALHAAFVVGETLVLCLLVQRMRQEHLAVIRLCDCVGRNSSALDELAAVSASSSAKQLTQVETLSCDLQQFNRLTRQIAEQARNAAQLAQDSADSAREGDLVISQSSEEIGAIWTQLADAAASVQHLAERSESIASIVETISEIAYRTNLLALNASIEAARAGEHGRGFAVVAGEIRRLSENTKNATGSIQEMIAEMRNSKGTALRGMEAALASAQSGRELSGNARQVIGIITERVQGTAQLIANMDREVGHQARDSENFDDRLGKMRQVTQASDQLVAQTAELAKSLQDIVRETRS